MDDSLPRHDWGPLAEDPFMDIDGDETPEWRAALRRIWIRNGGDPASFDEIIPESRVARADEGPASAGPGR